MAAGIGVTLLYIFQHEGIMFIKGTAFLGDMARNWFFGIDPKAFGSVGAIVNFATAFAVSRIINERPPKEIIDMIDNIRVPAGAGAAGAGRNPSGL